MWYTQCDEGIVKALTRILSRSLSKAGQSEVEDLLEALHVLRPDRVELDFFDVQLQIRRADWTSALHLLRQIQAKRGDLALCLAFQGWCLYRLRDPEWRLHVSSLLSSKADLAAVSVVGRFLKLPQLSANAESKEEKLNALRAGISEVLSQDTVFE
ncbi:hypothetical protein CY652_16380 [Burkholderia sp. WAC0059]|uniref:HrpB1 family type III secretion system apparatus protein n=1 Tax=Burkholderia sp. WAC0059 TaxID=2066022 RepID=UPI000C7F58AF|nr:HrpB1 family type III secretion system apparatus protein [Burkholderia sp. WAC0059]PLZ01405.1 hypothetical protein CY652_16380 [Burkholderia sp. WAC0059]